MKKIEIKNNKTNDNAVSDNVELLVQNDTGEQVQNKKNDNNDTISLSLLNFLKNEIKTSIESSEKIINTKIDNINKDIQELESNKKLWFGVLIGIIPFVIQNLSSISKILKFLKELFK